MGLIIDDIRNVASISSSDTNGIVSRSNSNFAILRRCLYDFLNNIKFDEKTNSIDIKSISTVSVKTTDIKVGNNGSGFSANSTGISASSATIYGLLSSKYIHLGANTSESLGVGNAGDIKYNSFKKDFFGYIEGIGWVSLTGGEIVVPTEQQLLYFPTSISGFISESELPTEGKDSYIINDGVNEKSIAVWDYESNRYVFKTPDELRDGTYVVDKNNGNIYTLDNSGDVPEWNSISQKAVIGNPTDGDYSDGEHAFTGNTSVSDAVQALNIDAKKALLKSYIAYKNVGGKAHTSMDKEYSDENIPGGIVMNGANVYTSDISDFEYSVENGLVAQISTTLSQIPGCAYSYMINNGERIISPSFGSSYDCSVYSNGQLVDPSNYIIQYASGVIIFDPDTPVSNGTIKYWKYMGSTVNELASISNVKLCTLDIDKHTTSSSSISVGVCAGVSLSENPKKNSYINVKVNGLNVLLKGEESSDAECYFVDKNDNNIIKSFSNISKGDLFYWTGAAGYSIDSTDRISFDYLIGGTDSSHGGGGGGQTSSSIKIVASETILSGTFVHIFTDLSTGQTGIVTASASNSALDADGFVLEGVSQGEEATVYLNGIVDTDTSGCSVGDYVYLGQAGTFDDSFDEEHCIVLQNVGNVVENGKLYINVCSPVIISE